MNKKYVEYLKLVAATIQTDYPDTKVARKAMVNLLEETDALHLSLTGNRIVRRGEKSLAEDIAGGNPVSRISSPKSQNDFNELLYDKQTDEVIQPNTPEYREAFYELNGRYPGDSH